MVAWLGNSAACLHCWWRRSVPLSCLGLERIRQLVSRFGARHPAPGEGHGPPPGFLHELCAQQSSHGVADGSGADAQCAIAATGASGGAQPPIQPCSLKSNADAASATADATATAWAAPNGQPAAVPACPAGCPVRKRQPSATTTDAVSGFLRRGCPCRACAFFQAA